MTESRTRLPFHVCGERETWLYSFLFEHNVSFPITIPLPLASNQLDLCHYLIQSHQLGEVIALYYTDTIYITGGTYVDFGRDTSPA